MSPRLATLGLPIRAAPAAWTAAALAFAVFALTMARDLTFYDSGELALVAHQLGLGHPIGQPLHTWLGFLFSHLPGVPPIVGLTLMSALFGALLVLPAWAVGERLAGEGAPALAIALPALGAALHPIAWEPSTRIEVYSLASFFALWAVGRACAERTRAWPIGLALGLAASANAVIAAAFGLGLLPRVIAVSRERLAQELGLFVLAGLAGLVPYAHLALVAGDASRFVWGDPSTPEALLAYLTGADYAHNAGIDAATFADHLGQLAAWGAFEASLPIAVAGLGAFAWRARARRGLAWSLPIASALCAGFVARNAIFHPDVPDYRGYLLAPWMGAAGSLAALAAMLVAKGGRFRAYGALSALLPLVALPVAGLPRPRRDSPALARAMIEGVAAEAPEGAVVLVEADHWVPTLLYAQEAERTRRDLVILPMGLASSSWYWEHLYARHPELAPFELRGPGGREARVRRFLAANARRTVLLESWSLAERAGVEPACVGWLLSSEPGCAPDGATSRLAALRPAGGEALEVAARIALERGEALWRLGRGAEAYAALLAGLDGALTAPAPRPSLPASAPPLRGPLPAWRRPAAVHDPARNLLVAAHLLDATERPAEALALLDLAERLDLPETAAARDAILARRRAR